MTSRRANPVPLASPRLTDQAFILPGRTRCPLSKFLLWLAPWFICLAWGLYASVLVLGQGLQVTRLDDRICYGLWITFDLGVMALAGGAFVSGLLLHVCRKSDLRQVSGLAVLLGFVCYTGAVGVLFLEIGQPLRAWFGFWHANPRSMLTEVIFCVTLYCIVLGLEFVPRLLQQRQLAERRFSRILGGNFQWLMPLFACVGVFLSVFHQGSLGGMYGVLAGRAFAFREGLFIWPWTFFLFVLSAAGAGLLFTLLITALTEKITGRRLATDNLKQYLGKTGGLILAVYVVCKALDTWVWAGNLLPEHGYAFSEMFNGILYGEWLLGMEIIVCGALPCLVLLLPSLRRRTILLYFAATLACLGLFINRYVQTVQNLAVPSLTFDAWPAYLPNWVELAPCAAAVAYGVIVISLGYRYLPLFPVEGKDD